MNDAKAFIEVVEIETGKVVEAVDVSGRSESYVERVVRGMLRNLNADRFFIREPVI